jgi:hypothetical protein
MEQIEIGLNKINEVTNLLNHNYCIVGSAAIYILGLSVGHVSDIDILTSSNNVELLKKRWSNNLIDFEPEKEFLFRSSFAQFDFDGAIIEVMGDLEIKKNNIWEPVEIFEYQLIMYKSRPLKLPSLSEIKRLLKLFGRPKDLERLAKLP